MRSAVLGFLGGALWLQSQAALPGATILLACIVASAVCTMLLRGPARPLASACLLGYCWAAVIAHLAFAHSLPIADEGRDLAIVGTVASLPHRFDGGVRFHFRVENSETGNASVPPRVALSWYGNQGADPGAIQPRRTLAPSGAPATPAWQRRSAGLRLRGLAAGAGRARNRLCATRVARPQTVALAFRQRHTLRN
jgi:hypothetical protein